MKYRGEYTIKNLRKDLDDGLGWAHSTESVAKYLENIVPSVREAQIKGYRHTSSTDENDPKKVVTTSFFNSKGKIGTCHVHGDGTWNLVFTPLGKKELERADASPTPDDKPPLEVTVRSVERSGCIYHYGEIINKPQACRGFISLNNDEVHRMHQLNSGIEEGDGLLSKSSSTSNSAQSKTELENKHVGVSNEAAEVPANPPRPRNQVVPYLRSRDQLSTEHEKIASELAREDITRKEERAIFQRLKGMPWEEQECILRRFRSIKAERTSLSVDT